MTQFGFLGHDAAHRQIFRSAAWNDWTSRVLAGFAGLSHGWWRGKHNRHHGAPNQEGRTPTSAPGVVAFTPAIVAQRTGVAGWFARHQGWLFFPLLTLEGINLHVASVRPLFSRGAVAAAARSSPRWSRSGSRRTSSCCCWCCRPARPGVLRGCSPRSSGSAWARSFAPNHKGMPIVPPTTKIDFLRRQVLMSRNVRGGSAGRLRAGRPELPDRAPPVPEHAAAEPQAGQPIVRAYCARARVSYTEVGLFESYAIVVDYLNNVGLRARGPVRVPAGSAIARLAGRQSCCVRRSGGEAGR